MWNNDPCILDNPVDLFVYDVYIGSPQGDCASPIWFIFYLHKALKSIKPLHVRNTEKGIKHDHNYTKTGKKLTKHVGLLGVWLSSIRCMLVCILLQTISKR